MKISVVTPSFNQGTYIRECLASVRLPSNGLVEHIILDNLSSDETPAILSEYAHVHDGVKRNIIIEADRGQTHAINRGFDLATGEVICWLNTDETYYPDTLTKVITFFEKNPEVDVLFGDCDFIRAGSLVNRRVNVFFSRWMLLYYGCYMSSAATFIRRKVIDDGHILNTNFRVAMDYEYYNRLCSKGYKFRYLNEVLATFLWHDTNISTSQANRGKTEDLTVKEAYSCLAGPPEIRKCFYFALKLFWIVVRVLSRSFLRYRIKLVHYIHG